VDAWQQVAQRAIRLLEQSCGSGTPAARKLREYATQHAQLAAVDVGGLVPRFIDVVALVELRVDEQNKIRASLARMLGLLCDNMRSLTPEETWLAGQLEPIRALLGGPLSADDLSTAEHTLAMVIERQTSAHRSLQDAKVALKEMLATLIDRIGSMGDSAGKFYQQVGDYQSKLEGANDFETLSGVIRGLLADTQVMRISIQSSRDELLAARRKVETYEARVRELERELSQVANLVQKDPLTQALNRRGLEEAFRIESARARRYGSEISFLLVDVDDFKKVNDSLGHLGGDRALVHLAQTLYSTLRPTDVLVRLGGEEFGVLLPSTALADAMVVAERLQRELARRTFEYEGRLCPLTFSGGVAQWRPTETLEQWIERADTAMYRAKRAGKNRTEQAQ
jgi:diguanylate cyclase